MNEPIQQCIHMSGWNGYHHKWADQIPYTFDEMKDYHMNVRKFSDVAYHFIIDPLGEVLIGRDVDTKPASATSHNDNVIAICLIGDFNGNRQITPDQRSSLKALLLDNCKKYIIPNGVAPKSCTDMHHIFGHCDYRDPPGNRYCPGTNLKRELTIIAREIFTENFRG